MASADAPTTFGTLNGLFKETYADNLENLLPKGLHFQNDIKWAERAKMPGNKFHQPVLLAHEHGFTYAGGSTSGTVAGGSGSVSSVGAFTIGKAVAGQTQDATIYGTQMLLRSQIDYESAARASGGGKRAFRRALDVVVENMFQSSRKRMEIDYIYGGVPLASCTSCANVGAVSTITISNDEWAPGIWAGMEGAKLSFFNNDGTAAAPDVTTYLAGGQLTTVNLVGTGIGTATGVYTITVTMNNSTEADALTAQTAEEPSCFFDSAGLAPDATSGTYSQNVFDGVFKVMNTTAGSIFGISVGNSLWQPTQVNASTTGILQYRDISNAVAGCVAKGLEEDLVCYVNPAVWATMAQEENFATTAYGGDVNRSLWNDNGPLNKTIGTEGLTFISQNGKTVIRSSNYVKQDHGIVFAPSLWRRIGASDLTFRLPDRGDEFFLHLTDNAGYELRAYCNHAVFTKAPGKSLLIKNIVA